jgi:glucosamine kinase
MKLIADSGSTKTSWCLIKQNGQKLFFTTEGYNPYFISSDDIVQSLKTQLPEENTLSLVEEIHFYGAGCYPDKKGVLDTSLKVICPSAISYIELDLLAAARALLGQEAGFAAILGTGTNTCLYDGKTITNNIDSLGYILGDEGSGCAIGKKLLGDYIRGVMPVEIKDRFWQEFHLTPEAIINEIYSQEQTNRFCASFSRFVNQHIDNRFMHDLVQNAFTELFENLVSLYPNYQQYSFNCVGAIGYTYQNILTDVVEKFQMKPGKFLCTPIEDLVAYHEAMPVVSTQESL